LAADLPHVLILVPDPVYPEPWAWAFHVEAEVLRFAGFEVSARPWTAPGDLAPFDAVLPLVVWGYHERYKEWLALLDRLDAERVTCINTPDLLRWNGDKAYLAELDAKGIPTVHTIAVDALDEHALREARDRFGCERLVVKPPISASATGTFLLQPGDMVPEEVAGRRMLVQPFMASIATDGEYSLMLFGGRFSHAILKTPKSGDFRVQPHLGGTEQPCEAPSGAVELGRAALAVAPADAIYARVDMIADDAGGLRIMELELIEPALWLQHATDGGAGFASSVIGAIEQPLP
jgi:glutathione synthase/RimK-type ligase-like ATP-grasp enzyme